MSTIKLLMVLLLLSNSASAQSERLTTYREPNLSYKTRVQYSRVWKTVGLTLMGTGLYMAYKNQNPQRLDVPLIGFGALITIEGIRLRKTAKK